MHSLDTLSDFLYSAWKLSVSFSTGAAFSVYALSCGVGCQADVDDLKKLIDDFTRNRDRREEVTLPADPSSGFGPNSERRFRGKDGELLEVHNINGVDFVTVSLS